MAELGERLPQRHRDPRAVLERASARETATRVALGALARQLLEAFGVELFAHVTELGGVAVRADAWDAAGERRAELRAASEFLSLDAESEQHLRKRVDAARDSRDSLGGVFEVRVGRRVAWSRKKEGRFPDAAELKQRVRDIVSPARDLGHIDHAKKPKRSA